MAIKFPEASQLELAALLPSKANLATDATKKQKYILLRQLTDTGMTYQPLLTFSTQILKDEKRLKVSLYAALAFLHPTQTKANANLRLIGYRFESPESFTGAHRFFHAQHVREFRSSGLVLNDENSDFTYIPIEQPSFIFPATCLVSFALSVLVTLYGGTILNEVRQSKAIPDDYLSQFEKLFSYGDSCISERILQ